MKSFVYCHAVQLLLKCRPASNMQLPMVQLCPVICALKLKHQIVNLLESFNCMAGPCRSANFNLYHWSFAGSTCVVVPVSICSLLVKRIIFYLSVDFKTRRQNCSIPIYQQSFDDTGTRFLVGSFLEYPHCVGRRKMTCLLHQYCIF